MTDATATTAPAEKIVVGSGLLTWPMETREMILLRKNAWSALIKRYAGDREICNCGDAYYTNCGVGIDASGKERNDLRACKYGCGAAQDEAKDLVAYCVLQELEGNHQ